MVEKISVGDYVYIPTDYGNYSSDNTLRSTLGNQIKNHYERLVEMFKDRL